MNGCVDGERGTDWQNQMRDKQGEGNADGRGNNDRKINKAEIAIRGKEGHGIQAIMIHLRILIEVREGAISRGRRGRILMMKKEK